MVKSVKINKNGQAEVEITMDTMVYEAAKGLLLSGREVLDDLGYDFEHYALGDGFEIFLELGLAYYIKNKETVEEDTKNAKLTILDELPQIVTSESKRIKKEIEMGIKPNKSDREKIRNVTEVMNELGEQYNWRIPKNVLITEMSIRHNISELQTEEIIKILKRKGIIFEPKQDYLKLA